MRFFLKSVSNHRDFLDAVSRLVLRGSKDQCSRQFPMKKLRAIPTIAAKTSAVRLSARQPKRVARPIPPVAGKATPQESSCLEVPCSLRATESLRKAYREWTSQVLQLQTKNQAKFQKEAQTEK